MNKLYISSLMFILLSCNLTDNNYIVLKKLRTTDNLKVLILGNSITGAPGVISNWKENCGLAASEPDKDYVHLLAKYLTDTLKYEPQIVSFGLMAFENNFNNFNLNTIDTLVNFNADLIIFRIGDNVKESEAVKHHFWEKYEDLISYLMLQDDQVIICTSSYYNKNTIDTMMRTTCQKLGITYLDISYLYNDKKNHASSEREFDDPGIGSHPGDRGMRNIANILWDYIISTL